MPENKIQADAIDSSLDEKKQNSLANKKKRNRVIFQILFVLLLIGLLAFLYWFFILQFEESTDDAYVDGNAVVLMAPQEGIVTTIYADNTQYVQQGQLLIELDTTNYQLNFDKARVDLALAARQVRQLWEDVQQRKADISLRGAEVRRAKQDFDNRAALQNTQAISKEDLTHAESDLAVAQANLNVAEHQLDAAMASLGPPPYEQQPLILNAKIAMRNAYVQLSRCKILAPASGVVAQRTVQVGEFITSTRALLSIIPTEQLWVNANFKETQLSQIRIGQPVKMTSDIYGSQAIYRGKVEGIVAGTGSVFSLIPPQNATGNWIKIVQRVPVRITLDPEQLTSHPLFLGLSNYVTVDISDVTGLQLAEKPLFTPRFETPVFNVNMDVVDQQIQEIIEENLAIRKDVSS